VKLLLQVHDESNACRFDATIEVDDDLFLPPNSQTVTLVGVKTALDYYLYEASKKAT
jgi:hypothetical protein